MHPSRSDRKETNEDLRPFPTCGLGRQVETRLGRDRGPSRSRGETTAVSIRRTRTPTRIEEGSPWVSRLDPSLPHPDPFETIDCRHRGVLQKGMRRGDLGSREEVVVFLCLVRRSLGWKHAVTIGKSLEQEGQGRMISVMDRILGVHRSTIRLPPAP